MSRGKIIFVTGTDTGVGKTLLSALLLHHLRRSGVHALAMKPFCSGGRADVRLLQSLQRGELGDEEVNPFYFSRPVAPFAAIRAGRKNVRLSEVLAKIRNVQRKCEWLIIEGSGGLFVPLGRGYTVADLIGRLNCGVIVAARNRLGTINHTWLTVHVLREMGVSSRHLRVVLMSKGEKDASCRSNVLILQELLRPIAVTEVPYLGKMTWKDSVPKKYFRAAKVLGRLAGC